MPILGLFGDSGDAVALKVLSGGHLQQPPTPSTRMARMAPAQARDAAWKLMQGRRRGCDTSICLLRRAHSGQRRQAAKPQQGGGSSHGKPADRSTSAAAEAAEHRRGCFRGGVLVQPRRPLKIHAMAPALDHELLRPGTLWSVWLTRHGRRLQAGERRDSPSFPSPSSAPHGTGPRTARPLFSVAEVGCPNSSSALQLYSGFITHSVLLHVPWYR